MVSVIYTIIIEAIICGFMLNRTLYSRTRYMWHMPLYVLVKTVACSASVYYGLIYFVTPLCMIFSYIYALICFRDSLKRKTAVVVCCIFCLGASNLMKFAMLAIFGVTQRLNYTTDVLCTVSILCFSLLFFCLFTIICTNILCGVRLVKIGTITLVHLLLMCFTALLYCFMHSLIDVRFNSLYTVYAFFLLVPAVTMLYFSESIVFARKDNYFKS